MHVSMCMCVYVHVHACVFVNSQPVMESGGLVMDTMNQERKEGGRGEREGERHRGKWKGGER